MGRQINRNDGRIQEGTEEGAAAEPLSITSIGGVTFQFLGEARRFSSYIGNHPAVKAWCNGIHDWHLRVIVSIKPPSAPGLLGRGREVVLDPVGKTGRYVIDIFSKGNHAEDIATLLHELGHTHQMVSTKLLRDIRGKLVWTGEGDMEEDATEKFPYVKEGFL